MLLRRSVLLCVLLVCGCGDDDGGTRRDGAAEDAVGASARGPAWVVDGMPPIEPPAVPADPLPGGPADCPPGQAQFFGDAACVPIGDACPSGEWADGLPSDAPVIYVRPGAMSGDGSRDSPFGSTREFSVGGLASGSVIALSAGEHEGGFGVGRAVTVWGACTERTRVSTSVAHPDDGVINIAGGGATLRNLSIVDSPRRGVRIDGAGRVGTLEGVEIANVQVVGIDVFSRGRLEANAVFVHDVQPRSGGAFGIGVSVIASEAQLSRVTSRDNAAESVSVDAAMVEATQLVVIGGGRPAITLTDSTVTVDGLLVDGTTAVGMAAGPGSVLDANDVTVRDVRPTLGGDFGIGCTFEGGAVGTLRRILVEGATTAGVGASGAGSALTAEDVTVRDTRFRPVDESLGRGIGVQGGASMTIARATLERNHQHGIVVLGAGSSLNATDLVVRDTLETPPPLTFGRGIEIADSARATLERTLVDASRDIGIGVGDGSDLDATDLAIIDTASETLSRTGGRGLNVKRSTARVTGALLRANHEVALLVRGVDASLVADEIVIEDTLAQECGTTDCPTMAHGHGLVSVDGASTRIERFAIRRSTFCGAVVSHGAMLTLSDGEVTGNEIGACVQIPGFDFANLTRDVAYGDNATNLDTTMLPVPEQRISAPTD